VEGEDVSVMGPGPVFQVCVSYGGAGRGARAVSVRAERIDATSMKTHSLSS